jgi:hypothetical protein
MVEESKRELVAVHRITLWTRNLRVSWARRPESDPFAARKVIHLRA